MIGRNRGCFHKQMLWMMAIISLYAVAFFIFHSPTYGMVHLACWLAVPLLAMYNGQRGRLATADLRVARPQCYQGLHTAHPQGGV